MKNYHQPLSLINNDYSRKAKVPLFVIKESYDKFYAVSPGDIFEFETLRLRDKFIGQFLDFNGNPAVPCKSIVEVRKNFKYMSDVDFYEMMDYKCTLINNC